eukprot:sb/3469648/
MLLDSALTLTDTATSCDALFHQLINNVVDNKKNSASGVIGILEALGLSLFKVVDTAMPLLRECLDFIVLHAKHQIRLYSSTVVTFSQILLLFLDCDRGNATKLLTSDYVERLERVDNMMRPRDPVVGQLIECLKNDSTAKVSTFDESQMLPYLAKLSLESPENLNILQDLDAGSMRKPSVLKMFLDEICRRMESDHIEYRTLAHKLAIRHVDTGLGTVGWWLGMW